MNPPRCLECGGFDVVTLPGEKEFRHPHAGEFVMELASGWADVGLWIAEFTPGGEIIRTTR